MNIYGLCESAGASDVHPDIGQYFVAPVSFAFPFSRKEAAPLPYGIPAEFRGMAAIDRDFGRCRFSAVYDFFNYFPRESNAFLAAARYAVIGATGLGDVDFFNGVLAEVKEWGEARPGAKLALEVFHLWLRQWLRTPGFDAWQQLRQIEAESLPALWRPMIGYSIMMMLLLARERVAAYSMAVSTLLMSEQQSGWLQDKVWLKVACALACREIDRREDEAAWFSRAIDEAAESGYALPFLGISMGPGSIFGKLLSERAPELFGKIRLHSARFHRNRVKLHNAYTGGNVSELLSPREFYMVRLVVEGLSYKAIAKRLNISLGRAKNIAMRVYEKLGVHSKKALPGLVW